MAIAKRAVSQPISLPAPTGGWNARDGLTAMQPLEAVTLTNWFPATTECALRNGYTKHATGITGQVETLMAYSGAATDKLFAIAGTSVYDVTSSGAVGAAVVTGLSNARWGYCNIATSGGNYLSMANGVDAPRNYDGSTWTTPTITGVTATTLQNPILYAERQFFIQKNTLKVWYLGVDSIAGAAAAVDIAPFMNRGGYIVAHGTWTIDAGTGVNDHYVIMTNRGQVIVYQGIDPTDPNNWSMVGVWDIGAPIGPRALYKYAGDMLIIAQDGVVPLSGALQSSRVQPRVAITDKIQYNLAKCCNPIPGDDVFGFVSTGKGLIIHRTNCPNATQLLANYGHRVVKTKWAKNKEISFLTGLSIIGLDDVGVVNKITNIISGELKINIAALTIESKEGLFQGTIKVYVHDKDELEQLVDRIKSLNGIQQVNRFDTEAV
jgi:predicted amino acid-binding ACT domain protein